MKNLKFILLILFVSFHALGQDINQFDSNGKRHGIWKKNFDDTDVLRYEGAFNHDKEVGLFKFYENINGKSVLAATKQFNDTNNLAEVKFFAPSGKIISEGTMDGRVYIGTWKYYQKTNNELLILEHFDAKGNLEGERFVYYPNGQISEKQFYKDGKLDGLVVGYSTDGKIIMESHYKLGELHGVHKNYFLNGDLEISGQYKNGKKEGVWYFYDKDKTVQEKDFSNPNLKSNE